MNLKNQRPIFVPSQLCEEVERLSKAALMDIAWCMATRLSGQEEDPGLIMRELRKERDAVVLLRKQLKEIQS